MSAVGENLGIVVIGREVVEGNAQPLCEDSTPDCYERNQRCVLTVER